MTDRRCLTLAILLGLLTVSPAQAEPLPIHVTAGGGFNICSNKSESSCFGFVESMALRVSAGYELIKYIDVTLDLRYGQLGALDEDFSLRTLHAIPGFKGWYPLGKLEIFGEAGFGVANITTTATHLSNETVAFDWSSFLGAKLGIGVGYNVNDRWQIGANSTWLLHWFGQVCTRRGDDKSRGDCQDVKKGAPDIPNLNQTLLYLQYTPHTAPPTKQNPASPAVEPADSGNSVTQLPLRHN